jgi:hypothetical protein
MQKLRGLVSQQMTMMGTWLQSEQTDKDLAQARREGILQAAQHHPHLRRREDEGGMVRTKLILIAIATSLAIGSAGLWFLISEKQGAQNRRAEVFRLVEDLPDFWRREDEGRMVNAMITFPTANIFGSLCYLSRYRLS